MDEEIEVQMMEDVINGMVVWLDRLTDEQIKLNNDHR